MPDASAELDVLHLLGVFIDRLLATGALEGSPYLEGEGDLLREVKRRARAASPATPAADVLAEAAASLGVRVTEDGSALVDLPGTQREAGVLAAWALSLGFVEGAASGAQAAVEALEQGLGGAGWFERR